MPQLDLKRDLAWLVGGFSDPVFNHDGTLPNDTVTNEVYGEFRELINADEEHLVFDSYEDFVQHYNQVLGENDQSALLTRVADFFSTVQEISASRSHHEDFIYRYQTNSGSDGILASQVLYADWRRGDDFFKALTEGGDPSLQEYLRVFDGEPDESKLEQHERYFDENEAAIIAEVAIQHHVEAPVVESALDVLMTVYPRDQAFEIIQNYEGTFGDIENLISRFSAPTALEILTTYPEQIGAAIKWQKILGSTAVMVMLHYGYLQALTGLHAADQKLILQRCFSPEYADFRKGCRDKFEAYTTGEKYPYHKAYAEYLERHFQGVGAEEILGFLLTESNGNRSAVSPGGYTHGLMQISRAVFADMHVSASDRPNDIYNYKSNMYAGTRYLVENGLQNANNPDQSLGVAIGNYNRGDGTMNEKYFSSSRSTLPEITSEYVSAVLLYGTWFSQLWEDGAAQFELGR